MNRRRRVLFGLGGLAAILLVAACAWIFGGGDPMTRAEAAAKAGRWSEVLTQSQIRLRRKPDDARARRLQNLALARTGRSQKVLGTYVKLGAEAMTASDFVSLSQVVEIDRRPALALLALEAAERIAPDDPEVRAATIALRSSIGRQGAISHVADHLATVPNGPALGQLVLELAALTEGDSSDDPTFDRVMMRDRGTLRKLNSPDSVRLFFARILIESASPGTALFVLNTIREKGPEAAWLRSRAHLQSGDIVRVSKDLKDAGDFAKGRTHEPEPALYVGANACRSCHPKEFESEQSSRHATTLSHGPEMLKIPLPDGPLPDPDDPKIVHTFTREGDNVRLKTRVGDTSYEALMDYALGSGHHGITLIGRDTQGVYREARISQYSENGRIWDITSGFSAHPGDPSEYLGKVLSPAGFRDCIHCHVTRFRSIADRSGPEAADKGIGCERCHGPGGNHVTSMKYGLDDLAIARFTDATGPQKMTACNGCHASDGTFPPTDPQYIRFQSTTLPFSKCYTESKGKLDCVTCHDPHRSLETSTKFYENKCLDCHGPKTSKDDDGFRRVHCPVNAKSDCVKCHMPREHDAVPHTSFTDHQIRVHREEEGR